LEDVRLASPFVLRTADPPLTDARGKILRGVRRIGKRIVLALDGDLYLVIHLMIAGRFHWHRRGARSPGKVGLAAFDFPNGSLMLTEASTKKRASLHLVRGEKGLEQFDPHGIEPLEAHISAFTEALTRESHTLKRALTDPQLFSGIGNAYSDEILHRARLSPTRLTRTLDPGEIERLFLATRATLTEWIDRLRAETGDEFPEHVTAFREGMAVHGRYRKPCPVCRSPVQRIVYAENESNYCATCQTGGRLLADRSLSRLLGDERPKTIGELEKLRHR
jgi:formamidopyrimidine-DNA glycosylase